MKTALLKCLAVTAILAFLSSCASSTKNIEKKTGSELAPPPTVVKTVPTPPPPAKDSISITGQVLDPANAAQPGVRIRTEPPSEEVYTNSVGKFKLTRGLNPQKYTFYAIDKDGNEGIVTAVVAYGKTNFIKIVLGKIQDITTMSLDSTRSVSNGPGKEPISDPR